MFKIVKNEPKYFSVAKSKVKLPKIKGAWENSIISKIRSKLRADILLDEQNLLCIYCEKEIDDNPKNSNIDHFKTRNLFPQETLNYQNLLVSCNSNGRCSNYKDTHIKSKSDYDNIINPITENPTDFFDYLITGEIVAIDRNLKAEFTIDIFQLGRKHDEPLSRQRNELAKTLKYHTNLSLDEIYDIFGNEFHSFINNIYKKLGT